MICHKTTDVRRRLLYVPQISGTVEWVEAGDRQTRGIPDVVKPSGRHEHVCVLPRKVRNGLGLAADALGVSPATRQRRGEESLR